MQFNPHKYQEYAIRYIEEHPVAAIFLDLGLGKTVITLTAIKNLMDDYLAVRKVLVIAPIRVAKVSWPDEIEKWDHLKDLRYSVACGTEKERLEALKQDADICIINRENVQWLIEKSGYHFDFDMVVIDELSSFKNHQAKRFKALMKVRPRVERIVGLTGTPTSNGLMDLFAEFRLLDMGKRLGRYITRYREAYFTPDRYNGPVVYSYKPHPWAEDMIYQKISDITISMKACDYLEMPELITRRYEAVLSKKEQEVLRTFKKNLIVELADSDITAANAASVTGKLTQMANGAVYNDDGEVIPIHERKLDALEDIIEAMNGKPVLVAYWFKHDLERIEKRLHDLGVCFARLDNEKNIRKWNDRKLQVGLIHPASAGHGLNLQNGGSTLVWYSMIWSLELYEQTIGRLYRQGQASKTVVVIHITAKGTIDERISKALESKKNTQNALIAAVKAEITEVKDDDQRAT